MIDVKKALSNPWVWGAGAAFGVVVMMISNSSKVGSSDDGVSFNPNDVNPLGDVATWQNTAASNFATNSANLAAAEATNDSNNMLAEHLKIIDAIMNMSGVYTAAATAAQVSADSVTKDRIEQGTSLAIDQNTNATRQDMIYVAADVSKAESQLTGRTSVINNVVAQSSQQAGQVINSSTSTLNDILAFAKAIFAV